MLSQSVDADLVTLSDDDMYRLLMILAKLEPLKSNIIMILAHLAPEQISGAELTSLLGYSQKARTIYRGVLDELQDNEFINVNKVSNQYAISINQSHPVMKKLYELTTSQGSRYTERLVEKLGELQ